MARVYHSGEQIIAKIGEAEVEVMDAEGEPKGQARKALEVSSHTYGRWKSGYGHMTRSEAKRLGDLEKETIVSKRLLQIKL